MKQQANRKSIFIYIHAKYTTIFEIGFVEYIFHYAEFSVSLVAVQPLRLNKYVQETVKFAEKSVYFWLALVRLRSNFIQRKTHPTRLVLDSIKHLHSSYLLQGLSCR
jgi:hypothetical protein